LTNQDFFFTSESVTEGHPDKISDRISDAILDAVMAKDPLGRVACETLVSTGLALVAGEITTDSYIDMPRIVQNTIKQIGYTDANYGKTASYGHFGREEAEFTWEKTDYVDILRMAVLSL